MAGMKLYKVTCRGMTTASPGQCCYGIAFVIAGDCDEAYRVVRRDLGDRDIGFPSDRELAKVELIAEDREYPDCGIRLFV